MGISDEYIWLENLSSSKVLKWIDAENKYLRELLNDLSNVLKDKIAKYFYLPYIIQLGLTKKGIYVLVREKDSYSIKLILDKNHISEIINSKNLGNNIIIQRIYTDDHGDLLAYSYSYAGSDEGILRVIDVDTGEVIDELSGVLSDVIWLDETKYYYVRFYRTGKTPDGVEAPSERVFLRESGKDEMVFGEGIDTSYLISLSKSTDNRKALITVSYGWSFSTVYAGDLSNPHSWRPIFNKKVISKPIDYDDGHYFILTYDDENGLGRIIKIDKNKYEVIIEPTKYPIQQAVIADKRLIVNYLINASSKLVIYDIKGKALKELDIKPQGTISNLISNGKEVVFKYESFFIPYRIYKLSNNDLELVDSVEISNDFVIDEEWIKSLDNTSIHVFIVRKRKYGIKHVLAYGYGGFGISLTPRFYPYIMPFIEDGGTFVVANIRGGCEFGEKWHRDGMREKKQNVFNDFISVIEYFKKRGSKVIAMGISNGGLLVGAVITQKPELLDGAIIGYPVLDMLRFHKLYIGKTWVPEYGNPDDPKDREFLIKYSPYHNIKRDTKYPPILVFTGLHDDRVHPSHAFKFVAKLRDLKAPIYLRTERSSGHSGAVPEVRINEYADILAFIYKIFGMENINE